MPERINVGIVGAGYISEIYLQNLSTVFADSVCVIAVADQIEDRARARSEQFGVEALTVDALLEHPEIQLVVNLTVPSAHAQVALAAVRAGKSVYNEKPLSVDLDDARLLLETAETRGVIVGAAPDTFLGGSLQTARSLIDAGAIGTPIGFVGAMKSRGHERWHPDPAFFYQPGGGPLFDMGPYYLTALASLLGPVRRVSAMAQTSFTQREIRTEPKRGQMIDVQTPTHILSMLEFELGTTGSLTTSFDVWDTEHSRLMLYGTSGTLRLADPNIFGGEISLLREHSEVWEDQPLQFDYTENSRGLGVADLAGALRMQTRPRASGAMAFHVLDVMHALYDSAERREAVTLGSTFERPELLALKR